MTRYQKNTRWPPCRKSKYAKNRWNYDVLTKKTAKVGVYSTWCSQAVTHLSTNHARRSLTSVIGREPVFSAWYGRRHETVPVAVHIVVIAAIRAILSPSIQTSRVPGSQPVARSGASHFPAVELLPLLVAQHEGNIRQSLLMCLNVAAQMHVQRTPQDGSR